MTDDPEAYRYRILAQEVGYRGYFRIDRYRLRHRRFDASWSNEITRECFERGDAVAVLPYDPERDQVVLIEQFRVGAAAYAATRQLKPTASGQESSPWLWEIVAGIIEAGEAAAEVARRETREEIGVELQQLTPIAPVFLSPGGSSEQVMLYCGRVDASQCRAVAGLACEDEDIRPKVLARDEALAWLDQGKINTAPAVMALQWLALNRERLLAQWQKAPSA